MQETTTTDTVKAGRGRPRKTEKWQDDKKAVTVYLTKEDREYLETFGPPGSSANTQLAELIAMGRKMWPNGVKR